MTNFLFLEELAGERLHFRDSKGKGLEFLAIEQLCQRHSLVVN